MNARQRRKARRAADRLTDFDMARTCGTQGYSGTTSYPDLMCVDGRMRDMDADGYDPSTWASPCKHCLPAEYAAWRKEIEEE
jgi:hypothetical protein